MSHLHVYEWAGAEDRRPLVEGAGRWSEVLLATRAVAGEWSGDRYALLEFVPADDVAALHRDAAVLQGWLDGIEAR